MLIEENKEESFVQHVKKKALKRDRKFKDSKTCVKEYILREIARHGSCTVGYYEIKRQPISGFTYSMKGSVYPTWNPPDIDKVVADLYEAIPWRERLHIRDLMNMKPMQAKLTGLMEEVKSNG